MIGANPNLNSSTIPGVAADQPYQTGDYTAPNKPKQGKGFFAGIARLLQEPRDFIWFADKKLKEK